jgi:hypothetical protein
MNMEIGRARESGCLFIHKADHNGIIKFNQRAAAGAAHSEAVGSLVRSFGSGVIITRTRLGCMPQAGSNYMPQVTVCLRLQRHFSHLPSSTQGRVYLTEVSCLISYLYYL